MSSSKSGNKIFVQKWIPEGTSLQKGIRIYGTVVDGVWGLQYVPVRSESTKSGKSIKVKRYKFEEPKKGLFR